MHLHTAIVSIQIVNTAFLGTRAVLAQSINVTLRGQTEEGKAKQKEDKPKTLKRNK